MLQALEHVITLLTALFSSLFSTNSVTKLQKPVRPALPFLPPPKLPTRRLPARFTAALAGCAVNSRCFCLRVRRVPNNDLLQRPGDGAISGSIGFGVRELLLVRVQEIRDVALGGGPAEFFVERGY